MSAVLTLSVDIKLVCKCKSNSTVKYTDSDTTCLQTCRILFSILCCEQPVSYRLHCDLLTTMNKYSSLTIITITVVEVAKIQLWKLHVRVYVLTYMHAIHLDVWKERQDHCQWQLLRFLESLDSHSSSHPVICTHIQTLQQIYRCTVSFSTMTLLVKWQERHLRKASKLWNTTVSTGFLGDVWGRNYQLTQINWNGSNGSASVIVSYITASYYFNNK